METIIKETYRWREVKHCSGCGDTLVGGMCLSCGIQREEFVKVQEERTYRYNDLSSPKINKTNTNTYSYSSDAWRSSFSDTSINKPETIKISQMLEEEDDSPLKMFLARLFVFVLPITFVISSVTLLILGACGVL